MLLTVSMPRLPKMRVRRDLNTVVSKPTNEFNLVQGKDFEKVKASVWLQRNTAITQNLVLFHSAFGRAPIKVLAGWHTIIFIMAERKTCASAKFKVGEISSDIKSDTTNDKVIFVKLSNHQIRLLPTILWPDDEECLSHRRIQYRPDNFTFDIFYESQDGIQRRFIQDLDGYPLLNLFRSSTTSTRPAIRRLTEFWLGCRPDCHTAKRICSVPVLEPFGTGLRKLIGLVEPDPIKSWCDL